MTATSISAGIFDAEREAIRQVVDDWVVYRDAADWERFRTVWHDDGYMMATWFQGTADDLSP